MERDGLVISTTLPNVVTERTRLARATDGRDRGDRPALSLATSAFPGRRRTPAFLDAGLVDEIGTYIMPVVLGGGQPFLPPDSRLRLDPDRSAGSNPAPSSPSLRRSPRLIWGHPYIDCRN